MVDDGENGSDTGKRLEKGVEAFLIANCHAGYGAGRRAEAVERDGPSENYLFYSS